MNTIPKWIPQVLWDAFNSPASFFKALMYMSLWLLYCTSFAIFLVYYHRRLAGTLGLQAKDIPWEYVDQENMAQLQHDWIVFRYEKTIRQHYPDANLTQFAINISHMVRLERLEKRMTAVEQKVGIHNSTLNMIEGLLPQAIVVREVNGQWEIPELFWRALHEKMSDGASPLWDAFLNGNQQRLADMSESTARRTIGDAVDKGHVLSVEMFREAIGENFATMEQHFGEQLRKSERLMLSKMKEEARLTTTETIEKTPIYRLSKLQANALAYANLLKNTQEAMQSINFFSPGLGARVNPHGTSLTYKKAGRGWFEVLPNPPITALQRWEEAGDCWCAAPSTETGRAQVEIIMAQDVYPEHLIIEHMPSRGTLQINAAPRVLELWLEAPSANRAAEISEMLEEDVLAHGRGVCGEAPSKKHICIGKGEYDIHHDNWVQGFGMFRPMDGSGIAGRKLVVRVTGNWGADYTCLYRLRLTGQRVVVTQ